MLATPPLGWLGQFALTKRNKRMMQSIQIIASLFSMAWSVMVLPGLGWPGLTLALLDLAWVGQFTCSKHVQNWHTDDAIQSNYCITIFNMFWCIAWAGLGWAGLARPGLGWTFWVDLGFAWPCLACFDVLPGLGWVGAWMGLGRGSCWAGAGLGLGLTHKGQNRDKNNNNNKSNKHIPKTALLAVKKLVCTYQ